MTKPVLGRAWSRRPQAMILILAAVSIAVPLFGPERRESVASGSHDHMVLNINRELERTNAGTWETGLKVVHINYEVQRLRGILDRGQAITVGAYTDQNRTNALPLRDIPLPARAYIASKIDNGQLPRIAAARQFAQGDGVMVSRRPYAILREIGVLSLVLFGLMCLWMLLAAGTCHARDGIHRARKQRQLFRWMSGVCPSCGHSLAGIPVNSPCPECGMFVSIPERPTAADEAESRRGL